MVNYQDNRAEPRPTPQEEFLIAAHAQRAAELRQQMDLIVLRGLVREAEGQQA
jgi:hypothetical protein